VSLKDIGCWHARLEENRADTEKLVSVCGLRYAGGMLWKKPWQPEAVLALAGGIVSAFVFANVAAGLLQHAGVAGFRREESAGNILIATLGFHGVALLLGTIFLKFHDLRWREVLGLESWKRALPLALLVLVLATPVMLGLKVVSELALTWLGFPVDDQRAVELILNAQSPWLRVYLGIFAVVLAPLAEEFIFRGLLFSACKKFGWPKLGWIGASFLFALIHFNAPTFLPLFVFALALTWLYEKTEGLLAPILAHSLFNGANLALLCLTKP
jgi:uncharacterized protein